jgi:tripartite-type tricarboxylate transporter receptor subunit TctC
MTARGLLRGLMAAVLLALPGVPAAADPVSDFYRDRQVNLISGFNPGGGFDIYARLVARYLPKYIPGEPHIIIRNMPGAGSMIATNHVFNVSPRDGSEFGLFSSDMVIAPLMGAPTAKFVAREFTWLGSASSDVIYCIAWGASPFKSFDQVFQSEMLVGAAGIQMANVPMLLNRVLGTKFKVIKGYAGTAAVKLAVQRGEVQGWCNVGLESVRGMNPEWITDGTVRFLTQVGYEPRNEVPNVPFFLDYAKNEDDKHLLKLIFGYPFMARPFAAPPKIPQDRAAALRNAFAASLKDEGLRAEAEQARIDIQLVTGEQVDSFLAEMYATDPKLVAKASQVMAEVTRP